MTGCSGTKAQRLNRPSNTHWRTTVEPDSNANVFVVPPATTDRDAQDAIRTWDGGRPLSQRVEFAVSGPGR